MPGMLLMTHPYWVSSKAFVADLYICMHCPCIVLCQMLDCTVACMVAEGSRQQLVRKCWLCYKISSRAGLVLQVPPCTALEVQKGCALRFTPNHAGIQDMLQRVAGEKGMVWEEFLERMKKGGQWRVEVY